MVHDRVWIKLLSRHVINLVIDNWPQWFVVAPGAINLVQGPANYEALLRMGIPEDKVSKLGISAHVDYFGDLGTAWPSQQSGVKLPLFSEGGYVDIEPR